MSGDERDLPAISQQCEEEPPVVECHNIHDGLAADTTIEEVSNAGEDEDKSIQEADVPCQKQSGLNPEAPEFVPSACTLDAQPDFEVCRHADDYGQLDLALMFAGATTQDMCKGGAENAFDYTGMYGDFFTTCADACGVLRDPGDISCYMDFKHATPYDKLCTSGSVVDILQSVRKQELNAARCIQKAWRDHLSRPRTRPSVPRPKRQVGMPGKSFRDAAMTASSMQDKKITNAWARYSPIVDVFSQTATTPKRRGKSLDSRNQSFNSVEAPSMRSRIALLGQAHEGVICRVDIVRGFAWIESCEVRRLANDNVRVDSRFSNLASLQIGDEVCFRIELSPDSRPRARKVWPRGCTEPIDSDVGDQRDAIGSETDQQQGKLQELSLAIGDGAIEHVAAIDDPWATAITEKRTADLPLTHETMLSQIHEGCVADYLKRKGHGFIKHQRIFDLIGKDVFYLGSDFPSARRANCPITFRVVMDRDGRPRAYPPKVACPVNSRLADPSQDAGSKTSPWASYAGNCSPQLGASLRSRSASDRPTSKDSKIVAPAEDLKSLMNNEIDGIIAEFHVESGHGFVKNDAVRNIFGYDIYFSASQFLDCTVGAPVKFWIELDDAGRPRVRDDTKRTREHPSSSSVAKAPTGIADFVDGSCNEGNLLTLEECLGSVHEGIIADYDSNKARGYVRNARVHRLFGKDVLFHKGQFEGCGVGDSVRFGVELDLDGRPRVRDLLEVQEDLNANLSDRCEEPLTQEMLLSTRHEGVIYQFAKDRGYGFVRNLAIQRLCGRDVFISAHHFTGREVGDAVVFNVELTSDGLPRARNVCSVGDEPSALTIEQLLSREHRGSIVDWDEAQGVGFIKNRQIHNLCGKDVLFRSGEFPGKIVGDIVCFSVALDEKGRPRTRDVTGEKIMHDVGKRVDSSANAVQARNGESKASGRVRSHSASARSRSTGRRAYAASEKMDLESAKYVLKLLTSDSAVALIIGRKAATISELSRSTGAHFTFTARDDCYIGTNFRVMTAFGPSERSLREALQQIVDMISDDEIERHTRSDVALESEVQTRMRPLVPVFSVPLLLGEDGNGLQHLSDTTGVSVALDSEIIGCDAGQEQTLTLTGGRTELRASFAWLTCRLAGANEHACFSQWASRTNTPSDPYFVKPAQESKATNAPGEFNVVLGRDFGSLGLQFRSDDASVVESCQHDLQEFWEERQRLCVGDRLVKVNGRLIQGRMQDALQELERRPVLLTFARARSLANANAAPSPAKREEVASATVDRYSRQNDSSWWCSYGSNNNNWTWNKWYSGDGWKNWSTNNWHDSYWDWKDSFAGYAASDSWKQSRAEDADLTLDDAEVRVSADSDV